MTMVPTDPLFTSLASTSFQWLSDIGQNSFPLRCLCQTWTAKASGLLFCCDDDENSKFCLVLTYSGFNFCSGDDTLRVLQLFLLLLAASSCFMFCNVDELWYFGTIAAALSFSWRVPGLFMSYSLRCWSSSASCSHVCLLLPSCPFVVFKC